MTEGNKNKKSNQFIAKHWKVWPKPIRNMLNPNLFYETKQGRERE